MERLLAGNARFVADRKLEHDPLRRAELAGGQNPFAVILGCADSRVPPELVFDQGLGELFVVRVAGNTAASPLTVGSVEFAVANLATRLVVVLGHQGCGAVGGAVATANDGTVHPGSIAEVVAPIVPVVAEVSATDPGISTEELCERSVRANVSATVAELAERSPLIAERVEAGEVELAGAEYRLATGEVALV